MEMFTTTFEHVICQELNLPALIDQYQRYSSD